MKFFSTFCLGASLLFLSFSLSAQAGYYNALLDYVGTEIPFEDDVKQVAYVTNGTHVVEYYSLKSDRFLGITIDKKSIDVVRLKFIKKDKQLRRLIKKHGLKEALTFLYDNVTPGMSSNEVYSILGKPSTFKYNIDNTSQILSCHFVDSIYKSFVFRDDVLEKINYL